MAVKKLKDLPENKKERKEFFDQKAEQIAESKQEELLVDFDEAYEEYKDKEVPLVVRFQGERFEVPRKRPTSVTLFSIRNQSEGALTDDKYYKMIEMVLGKKFIRKMEECDAPLEFVTKTVMQPIFEKWGVKGTDYKKK